MIEHLNIFTMLNNYKQYDIQQHHYQGTGRWMRLFSLLMFFVIVDVVFHENVCTLQLSIFVVAFTINSGGSGTYTFGTTSTSNTNQQHLQYRNIRRPQQTFITSALRYGMIETSKDISYRLHMTSNDHPISDAVNDETTMDKESNAITSNSSNEALVYRFRGVVQTGYGRGSRTLGFPTANIGPIDYFDSILTLHNISTGVYMGYATLERRNDSTTTAATTANEIYKTVVNIGYSPTFVGQENRMKIIEAHLIAPFRQDINTTAATILNDFYNTTIRLLLFGGMNYKLRNEIKFASIQELIQQITSDINQTNQLLNTEPYILYPNNDPFLTLASSSSLGTSDRTWIGRSGGNSMASYEIDVLQ